MRYLFLGCMFFVVPALQGSLTERCRHVIQTYYDSRGHTLIHRAFLQGDLRLLERLAKLGIDLSARDARGETIVDHANRMCRSRL